MDIKVQAVHFKADSKLIDFINTRVSKLETFYDQIISSDIHLKLGKDGETENKIAEVKIHVPGKELFVSKQCKSFEEATDQAVDVLARQVKKYKEKASA